MVGARTSRKTGLLTLAKLRLGDILYILDILYTGDMPMAGRPKREEEVTSVLLRIPPALLKRVERCQALLQLREDTRFTRTEAFWRIIEAGCRALEGEETPNTIAESQIPVHYGRPGISREKLQEIADEHTLCEGLTMRDLAQRLFDKDIYRAKGKDGRAVPVDHSRLRRWLEQAREAGLL
jgi:hypothetical protein